LLRAWDLLLDPGLDLFLFEDFGRAEAYLSSFVAAEKSLIGCVCSPEAG